MCLKLVIIGVALLGFVASTFIPLPPSGNEDTKPNLCCPQNEKLYDYNYPCKKNMCRDFFDYSSKKECNLPATYAKNKYCDCMEGYWRLDDGPCVKSENCDILLQNQNTK
uniref:Protease inibitor S17B2 n=1 Tax=Mayetiola destructor TaxID=39758 RepID=Q0QVU7_MAYDE|nr:protease inibitor S17B2 [Mayetiola destructor]